MPKKLPHICNKPGCTQLTTSRYCEKHTKESRQSYNRKRKSAAERGYDYTWQIVSERYLHKHPLCERCEKKGRIVSAVLVHHKKYLEDSGERLDEDNCEALCNDCHEKEHKKERFRQKTAKKGEGEANS